MNFNYEEKTIEGLTLEALLEWVVNTEFEYWGEGISTETEHQMEIIVSEAQRMGIPMPPGRGEYLGVSKVVMIVWDVAVLYRDTDSLVEYIEQQRGEGYDIHIECTAGSVVPDAAIQSASVMTIDGVTRKSPSGA